MPTARMRVWVGAIVLGVALVLLQGVADLKAQSTPRNGTVLSLEGAVTPAAADYLTREIAAASARREEVVILEIDTPGGLVDSMKSIIKGILASDTPVVTYVSPQGARSASAGLYIMYAAHVSAMAPATNTGSATPIELGGTPGGEPADSPFPLPSEDAQEESAPTEDAAAPDDGEGPAEDTAESAGDETDVPAETLPPALGTDDALRAKVINDSVAYIVELAKLRGRDEAFAEAAVREAANIGAEEALARGVIEIIAEDRDDLLRQIDGLEVETASGSRILNTEGLALTEVEPSIVEKVLGFFANPNVAAILLTLGTTGLIVEMWNPGSIFPGAVGIVSLCLALYSFQVLPFNVLALAMMAIGAILLFVELFTPTFGIAGLSGIGLFAAGLWFLFPDDFRVAPAMLIGTVATAGIFLAAALFAIAGSRSHGPLIGQEAIRKRDGRVDDWDPQTGEGHVIVDGERWRARSKEPLAPGDRIRVQDVDGIVLIVRKNAASPGMSRFMPQRRRPT